MRKMRKSEKKRRKRRKRRKGEKKGRKRERKGEKGRHEHQNRMSDDNVSKQGTTCPIMLRPLNGMSKVLRKNDCKGPMVETEGARDV